MTQADPAAQWQHAVLLRTHLAAAVPLRIDELRGQSEYVLDVIRAGLPERLQHADAMQFGGGAPGEAGHAASAWTTALALLALHADGGVDFLGLHWCRVAHCRANSRYEHADGTGVLRPREPPRGRPIESLPDLAAWEPANT